MSLPINIPAILIANAMGITIFFAVAVGSKWRLKKASKENKYLFIMLFCSFLNCIADPIGFLADGNPGLLNRILVTGCNSLLYFGGAVIAFVWVFLVANHFKVKLHRTHRTILYIFFGFVVCMLVANLFVPVVFTVSDNNVYARIGGYWIYTAYYTFFMLDGIVLRFWNKHTSGGLKFFPVWAFIVPAALGVSIQVLFYGVSTATPFTSVSIVCVILCLQNEQMLRDKFTGLYNRFYLEAIEKKACRYPKLKYTAILLDINGFKSINDTYGHRVGDEALIQLSSILIEAVGEIGEAIRYGGDEFIIVLNTQDEEYLKDIISNIYELLDKLNHEKNNPYILSVAIGYCKLDFKENTLDSFIDKIDKLMYENKREYYLTHTRYDRRRS